MSQWYYARNKRKHGPISSTDLRARLNCGELQPTDMVLEEGSQKWLEARFAEELVPVATPACIVGPRVPPWAKAGIALTAIAISAIALGIGLLAFTDHEHRTARQTDGEANAKLPADKQAEVSLAAPATMPTDKATKAIDGPEPTISNAKVKQKTVEGAEARPDAKTQQQKKQLSAQQETQQGIDASNKKPSISGKLKPLTFKGHTAPVTSVVFGPQGRTALSGSDDGTVRQWDLETGQQVRCLKMPEGWAVMSVALAPDERYAAAGGGSLRGGKQPANGTVVWDLETGRALQQLGGHTRLVSSVVFSADGKRILSGSYDGTLRLWDVQTGIELKQMKGHKGEVMSVALSKDGRRGLSGGADRSVRLWDLDTGREQHRFDGHRGYVESVAFAPDGTLLSGSTDGTVRSWDPITGEARRIGKIPVTPSSAWDLPFTRLAFSADGQQVLTNTNPVRLWNTGSFKEMAELLGHASPVEAIALSADGRWALSGGKDHTVRLCDLSGRPEPENAKTITGPWESTPKTGLSKLEQGSDLQAEPSQGMTKRRAVAAGLVAQLKNADAAADVRSTIIELGKLGPAASEAVNELMLQLHGPYRREAAEALSQIGPMAKSAINSLFLVFEKRGEYAGLARLLSNIDSSAAKKVRRLVEIANKVQVIEAKRDLLNARYEYEKAAGISPERIRELLHEVASLSRSLVPLADEKLAIYKAVLLQRSE